jgi:hypothetical protein
MKFVICNERSSDSPGQRPDDNSVKTLATRIHLLPWNFTVKLDSHWIKKSMKTIKDQRYGPPLIALTENGAGHPFIYNTLNLASDPGAMSPTSPAPLFDSVGQQAKKVRVGLDLVSICAINR